ncbi:MAG: alpha/beta fold hydrolase [Acidimicrobiia bacterium]|nr:alpha/beta fold hydrolase [Acidimicrobiia bacterium]
MRRATSLLVVATALAVAVGCAPRQLAPRQGFIPVTGGRVWYEVVAGPGSGVPVMVLHGGPGGSTCSMAALAELSGDRPVVFYDQLGGGRSEQPADLSLWRLERFVEELDRVRGTLRLSRVHLLGHSWGAYLAAAYLKRYGTGGIASVTFSSPLLSSPKWTEDAERLKRTLPEDIQKIIRDHEAAGTTESPAYQKAMDVFYERYVYGGPRPVVPQCRGVRGGSVVYNTMWGPSEFTALGNLKDVDATPGLPRLRIPVLFLAGRFDEATPETVAGFQRLVPGSRMVVFEKSAHGSFHTERERYLQTVREFLADADRP